MTAPLDLMGGSLLARVAEGLDPQPDPWVHDPEGWIRARLGEFTWSKQGEILRSLRDHKKTAVRSAHSTGKSHIAARAIAHWISCHPIDDVFVVSTAPSANQVRGILWRYLKRIQRKAGLPGYITESEVPEWKIDGTLVAWGRKPADLSSPEEAATVFQGMHARYILIVLDEAGGIPEWLWNAVMTLATQPTNRVLAIGNPDDPSSHFEKICRPGSDWNKIKISAFDTPAFTGESVPQEVLEALVGPDWVAEAARAWGETSPIYTSKVLAEFPISSDDNLIRMDWIKAACERDFSGEAIADYGKFVLDVAREGSDEAVYAHTRAGMFRIRRAVRGIQDTMKLVGWMSNDARRHPMAKFMVDADGLGGPVFDRARELDIPISPFHAGRRAYSPKKFVNRRSEQWWTVRELFEDGLFDIDAADELLQAQLGSIKWSMDSAGRIAVETKKEMKKRGLPSPDRADTLMMSTAPFEDYKYTSRDPVAAAMEDHFQDDGTITGDLLHRPM